MHARRRNHRLPALLAATVAALAVTGVATPAASSPTTPSTPAAPGARALPAVPVTELPALDGTSARPWDVNDRGQVVGESMTAAGTYQAVLWEGGEVRDLTPDVTDAFGTAHAVNRSGLVLGGHNRGLASDAFVWDDGAATLIPSTPSNVPVDLNDRGEALTNAYDVTDWSKSPASVWRDGEVTASPQLPDGAPLLGADISNRGTVVALAGYSPNYLATWRPGQAPVALPNPEGAATAFPSAINDLDVVVGNAQFGPPLSRNRVVVWRNGRPTDIGTLGGESSGVLDTTTDRAARSPINIWGHVVGGADTATGQAHAFLWRNGRMTDLGTLGGTSSVALALNDVGQVVGRSSPADGVLDHPFLWQRGRMLDLTTIPGLEHLTEVTDINNLGQMVGVVDAPDAEPQAVLFRVSPLASL